MMGRTHALAAGVGWLAVAPYVNHYHHLTPGGAALGTVVATGAGLLPDLDHHSGTIANTFGPITRALCKSVSVISGGHRHATHSLLAAAAVIAATHYSARSMWASAVLVWVCIGLAVRALGPHRRNHRDGRLDWRDFAGLAHAAAAAGAAVLVVHHADTGVLPWAVGVGYLTHLVTDAMTEKGEPLLWPSARRFRIASIDTGKTVEKVFAAGLCLGLVLLLAHGLWAHTFTTPIR